MVAVVDAERAIAPAGIEAGVGVAIVGSAHVGSGATGSAVVGGGDAGSVTGPAGDSGAEMSNSCPSESILMSVKPFNCTNCSGETWYRSAMA